MTKAVIGLPLAEQKIVTEIAKSTGIDKASVLSAVEQFMTVVKDSLAHGENVYLRGFGSFIVKRRADKTARNINKNTTLIVPAHNIPAFKPANGYPISKDNGLSQRNTKGYAEGCVFF